jgi:hypothetical protein
MVGFIHAATLSEACAADHLEHPIKEEGGQRP